MHRTAFPLAVAGGFAEQFGHHPVRRRPFGDAMPMPPMGAGDLVFLPQNGDRAGSRRFLADTKVGGAVDHPFGKKLVHLFVKISDYPHLFVQLDQFVICDAIG